MTNGGQRLASELRALGQKMPVKRLPLEVLDIACRGPARCLQYPCVYSEPAAESRDTFLVNEAFMEAQAKRHGANVPKLVVHPHQRGRRTQASVSSKS